MRSSRALVLDGSLGFAVVAIVEERAGLPECAADDLNYDQPLLKRINTLVPTQDERAALTEVVVGNGPGSYSGIRVAASAGVGIAAAMALPLRESPSDRALCRAMQRSLSIPLGTRESLEISEDSAFVVERASASPQVTREEIRHILACAIVQEAGPAVQHVTLRYPAPARGSEVK